MYVCFGCVARGAGSWGRSDFVSVVFTLVTEHLPHAFPLISGSVRAQWRIEFLVFHDADARGQALE